MSKKVERIRAEIEKRRRLELTSPLEAWVESWIMKLNVKYQREVKCGKYLIDFVFEKGQKRLALEVDGKHHNKLKYKRKDIEKDKYLNDYGGYEVLRVESDNLWSPLKLSDTLEKIYMFMYPKNHYPYFLIELCGHDNPNFTRKTNDIVFDAVLGGYYRDGIEICIYCRNLIDNCDC